MDNFKKLMDAVASSDIDALLIVSPVNRYYASGFDSSDGMVVIAPDKAWFFTDSRYIEAAEKSVKGAEVGLVAGENTYLKLLGDIIGDRKIGRLGFEEDSMTFSEYKRWSEKLDTELKPAQKLINGLRTVKTEEELACMINAQRIAEKSFREILPLISRDMTEKELAAELLYRFQKNGGDDKSFDTIAVSGKHSSMPHGVPTDEKLAEGFLTLDFGVRACGWCSDTTRTLCLGEPTDEMRFVYDTVLNAQLKGIAAAKAGVPDCDVDGAARKVIADAGYGEYFGHSFGHGLGLEVHEYPFVSPKSKDPLPKGAVISAEPGIYLPDKFGVRIEDVLYITENGSIDITDLPKELIIL